MLFRLEAIQKMIDLAIPTLLDDSAKELLLSIKEILEKANTLEQKAWDARDAKKESTNQVKNDRSTSYSLSSMHEMYSFFMQKIIGKDMSEIHSNLTFSSIVQNPEDWDNIQKNLMAVSLYDVSLEDSVLKTFERFLCDQILQNDAIAQGPAQ